jgi:hypothetical protein
VSFFPSNEYFASRRNHSLDFEDLLSFVSAEFTRFDQKSAHCCEICRAVDMCREIRQLTEGHFKRLRSNKRMQISLLKLSLLPFQSSRVSKESSRISREYLLFHLQAYHLFTLAPVYLDGQDETAITSVSIPAYPMKREAYLRACFSWEINQASEKVDGAIETYHISISRTAYLIERRSRRVLPNKPRVIAFSSSSLFLSPFLSLSLSVCVCVYMFL